MLYSGSTSDRPGSATSVVTSPSAQAEDRREQDDADDEAEEDQGRVRDLVADPLDPAEEPLPPLAELSSSGAALIGAGRLVAAIGGRKASPAR